MKSLADSIAAYHLERIKSSHPSGIPRNYKLKEQIKSEYKINESEFQKYYLAHIKQICSKYKSQHSP